MESLPIRAFRAEGAESIAIAAGGLVFTGGVRAANLTGETRQPAVSVQAEVTVVAEVLEMALDSLGSSIRKACKTKIHLSNMADAPAARAETRRLVGDTAALTVVGMHLPRPADRLSMEIVAGIDTNPRRIEAGGGPAATTIGPLVFAGANPLDGSGRLPSQPDLPAQARLTLDKLVASIQSAGAEVDDIVKVNNTAASWHSFNLYNQAYNTVFARSQAARCSVSGVLEDPCALVEVEAIACLGPDRSFIDSTHSGVGREQFEPDPRTTYLPTIGPCKGPHTHGARAGRFVFIAGECPYDPEDRLVGWGDIEEQTVRTMRNVQISLEALGATCADVVRTNVTLSDARLFGGFDRGYRQFFRLPFPARTVVATPLGQYGILVEIEAIAVIGAASDGVAIIGAGDAG